MKKFAASLCVVLALTLGIALAPALSSAAEFSFAGPPAFSFTYPDKCSPIDKTNPDQVLACRYPSLLEVYATVSPIPAGVELKDVAEKAYKPGLEDLQKTLVRMGDNNEITLSDGTKAYYSEVNWVHPPTQTPIVTMVVSAYKDGKWVYVESHPWDNFNVPTKIVKSLKFK